MTDVEPASDHHIESMKRFWEETPPEPDMRILNARLLKQDFLSLIARLEEAEPSRKATSAALLAADKFRWLFIPGDGNSPLRTEIDDVEAFTHAFIELSEAINAVLVGEPGAALAEDDLTECCYRRCQSDNEPEFGEDELEVTPSYWVRLNSSGKPTFWEGAVPDGIPLYKRATAPNGARARNDFLEEAARICEALAASVLHPNQTITDRCAAAIRAAKAAPASAEAGQ